LHKKIDPSMDFIYTLQISFSKEITKNNATVSKQKQKKKKKIPNG